MDWEFFNDNYYRVLRKSRLFDKKKLVWLEFGKKILFESCEFSLDGKKRKMIVINGGVIWLNCF